MCVARMRIVFYRKSFKATYRIKLSRIHFNSICTFICKLNYLKLKSLDKLYHILQDRIFLHFVSAATYVRTEQLTNDFVPYGKVFYSV